MNGLRRFSSINVEPVRPSQAEMDGLKGAREYQEFQNLFGQAKFQEARRELTELIAILDNARQYNSLGYCHVLKRLAFLDFLVGDFGSSEKHFLLSKETVSKHLLVALKQDNPASLFEENVNLALLYTFSKSETASAFVDGEIQMIYEKKRAYDQDEQYFTWLDEFSQPRLSALLGADLTTCEEFKDADKTLRICLGRLLGKEQSSTHVIASLQNNLAVNYWLNADQADKAVERFQDAINRIFCADL